jgi:hypothetical protein
MKKLLFSAIALVAFTVTSMAGEVKNEDLNKSSFTLIEKNVKGEILNVKNFDSKEDLLRYCYTYRSYWYQYSYTGMNGQEYDMYQVVQTTICYTV